MRVISPKTLRIFWQPHPIAKDPLDAWRRHAEMSEWSHFEEVKAVFGKRVDRYGKLTIFDIGGNKYRLIVAIHYNMGRIYVRHVLTHDEYNLEKWKEE